MDICSEHSIFTMEDLKKYFDENNYITKIIGATNDTPATSAKEDVIDSLITLLTFPENKAFREEALLILKKEKRGDLLIRAVQSAETDKHKLIAACWESEINFNNELPFFVDLALNEDYLISLEAITVIGTMEAPFEQAILQESIAKVKVAQSQRSDERAVLLNDLRDTLQSFMK